MEYRAKFPTLLKKRPIQGDQLSDGERVNVPSGKIFTVDRVLETSGSHRHIELAFEAGSWWIFLPHWKIDSEDRTFVACKARVLNRGVPPDDFLNELIEWCLQAPDEIFLRNDNNDIYSQVSGELGPLDNLTRRKAIMLEVLRVLGGFESSWDWNAGRDITNPSSNTPCTEEAGIFQCSGNSMDFDSSLKALLKSVSGKTDCKTFRSVTKSNHEFAIEYCARLLRFTINHHGPVKRKEINPWLRRDAVEEFKGFISN